MDIKLLTVTLLIVFVGIIIIIFTLHYYMMKTNTPKKIQKKSWLDRVKYLEDKISKMESKLPIALININFDSKDLSESLDKNYKLNETLTEILPTYYDKNGNKITCLKWGELFEKQDHQILDMDFFDKYKIITVCLGMSNNIFSKEKNIYIFESVVTKNYEEIEMHRFSTEKKALKGHKVLCEKYKNKKEKK